MAGYTEACIVWVLVIFCTMLVCRIIEGVRLKRAMKKVTKSRSLGEGYYHVTTGGLSRVQNQNSFLYSILFVLTFFSPLFYEFPKQGLLFRETSEGKLEPLNWGAFQWTDWWIKPSNFSNRIKIKSENPRVRDLWFSLDFEISDVREYYFSPGRREFEGGEGIGYTVKTWVSEFNKSNPDGLSHLDDPRNINQQNEFREAVSRYIQDQLDECKVLGISFVVSDFRIK